MARILLHAAVAVVAVVVAFGLQFRRGGAGAVGVAADAGIVGVVCSWLVHRVGYCSGSISGSAVLSSILEPPKSNRCTQEEEDDNRNDNSGDNTAR